MRSLGKACWTFSLAIETQQRVLTTDHDWCFVPATQHSMHGCQTTHLLVCSKLLGLQAQLSQGALAAAEPQLQVVARRVGVVQSRPQLAHLHITADIS